MKEDQRRWYDQGGKKRIQAHKEAHRQRNRAYVKELKRKPCTDCGNEFPPEAMQFDHLRDKDRAVSVLVEVPASIDRIQREIDKCELVCANCHAIRTAKRRAPVA